MPSGNVAWRIWEALQSLKEGNTLAKDRLTQLKLRGERGAAPSMVASSRPLLWGAKPVPTPPVVAESGPVVRPSEGWVRQQPLVPHIPASYGGTPVTQGPMERNGVPVAARYYGPLQGRQPSIQINPAALEETHQRYLKGEYRVPGVNPVPGLNDPQRFLDFLLEHEAQHGLHPREGRSLAENENRINQKAMEALAPGSPPPAMGPAKDIRREKWVSKRAQARNWDDRQFQWWKRGKELEKRPSAPVVPEEGPGPKIVQALMGLKAMGKSIHPSIARGLVEMAKTGEAPHGLEGAMESTGLLRDLSPTKTQSAVEAMTPGATREMAQRDQLHRVVRGEYDPEMQHRIEGETGSMTGARRRRLRQLFKLFDGLPIEPNMDKIGRLEKEIVDDKPLLMKLQGMTPTARAHALGKITDDTSMMAYAEHKAGLPMKSVTEQEPPVRAGEDDSERAKTRTSEVSVKKPMYEHLAARFLHEPDARQLYEGVGGTKLPETGLEVDLDAVGKKRVGAGFSQADIAADPRGTSDIYGGNFMREGFAKNPQEGIEYMQGRKGREDVKEGRDPWAVNDRKGFMAYIEKVEKEIAPFFVKNPEGSQFPYKWADPKIPAKGTVTDELMGAPESVYKVKSDGTEERVGGVRPSDIAARNIFKREGAHWVPVRTTKTGKPDIRTTVTSDLAIPTMTFITLHIPEAGLFLREKAPALVEASYNRVKFLHDKNMKDPSVPKHLKDLGAEALSLFDTNPALGSELFRAVGTALGHDIGDGTRVQANPGAASLMERRVRAALATMKTPSPHLGLKKGYVSGQSGLMASDTWGVKSEPSVPIADLSAVRSGRAHSTITGERVYPSGVSRPKAEPDAPLFSKGGVKELLAQLKKAREGDPAASRSTGRGYWQRPKPEDKK